MNFTSSARGGAGRSTGLRRRLRGGGGIGDLHAAAEHAGGHGPGVGLDLGLGHLHAVQGVGGGGNVTLGAVQLKAGVGIGGGHLLGLAGNKLRITALVLIARAAGETIVKALDGSARRIARGILSHGVLTVHEGIVLGEDVGIGPGVQAIAGLPLEDIIIKVHVGIASQGAPGLTVLIMIVVPGDMVLQRVLVRADQVGLVVALEVVVVHGHVLTLFEITGAIAPGLVALGGVGDLGAIEGVVVDPAPLDGRCGNILALHAQTILGHVAEGQVPGLKALAQARFIGVGTTDKVEAPAVDGGVRTDALQGDVLGVLDPGHGAVVPRLAAVVIGVFSGQALGEADRADEADHQRGIGGHQLQNVLVGVGRAPLIGGLAGAVALAVTHIPAGGVEDVADAGHGDAPGGQGHSLLVGLGDVDDPGAGLQGAVVIVGAHALGVLPVGVARTVVGLDLNARGGNAVHRQGVGARGHAGDVDARPAAHIPDQVLQVLRVQRAAGSALPADAGDLAGGGAVDLGHDGLQPAHGGDGGHRRQLGNEPSVVVHGTDAVRDLVRHGELFRFTVVMDVDVGAALAVQIDLFAQGNFFHLVGEGCDPNYAGEHSQDQKGRQEPARAL